MMAAAGFVAEFWLVSNLANAWRFPLQMGVRHFSNAGAGRGLIGW